MLCEIQYTARITSQDTVLILVLMEDALRALEKSVRLDDNGVSILVLMEDTLRE